MVARHTDDVVSTASVIGVSDASNLLELSVIQGREAVAPAATGSIACPPGSNRVWVLVARNQRQTGGLGHVWSFRDVGKDLVFVTVSDKQAGLGGADASAPNATGSAYRRHRYFRPAQRSSRSRVQAFKAEQWGVFGRVALRLVS